MFISIFINMNAQQNVPAIVLPVNSVWAHDQIKICRKKLEKIEQDLHDPRPCKIAKHPQLQVAKNFWENRLQALMTALGL